MRWIAWLTLAGAAAGGLLALAVGSASSMIVFVAAGAVFGALLDGFIEDAGRRRAAQTVGEATAVLERVLDGEGTAHWYVAPEEGLEQEALRLNTALERLADEREATAGKTALLDALIAHAGVGVLVVDAKRRITLMSPRAAELFETSSEGSGGKPLVGLSGLLPVDALLEGGADMPLDVEVAAPGERTVRVRAAPLGDGHVLLITDLSAVRRLETAQADLLANVAHEIRTPLTAIRGFTETLGEPSLDEKSRARFLRIMGRETERLSSLVTDLLHLMTAEGRRPQVVRQEVDAARLLRELAEGAEERFRRKGVRLGLDAPDRLLVQTDPGRVSEILASLLDNALKFTPPGGETRLSGEASDGRVVFTVRDSGPGIPEKDLPRIFDRFYRVDPARSRASGGTGLGLAIARRLADSIGARLEVESEEGAGTTFRLRLIGGGRQA